MVSFAPQQKLQLRLGTRQSELALTQANLVSEALRASGCEHEIILERIITAGDKKQGTAAAAHGDKKDWIAEIETALVEGRVDFAVHSAKDVPIDIDPATEVHSVLPREDPEDVIVFRAPLDSTRNDNPFSFTTSFLPKGSIVGTASLRRRAQLLALRPDLSVVPVRGNVPTRLKKLSASAEPGSSNLAAVILARAGIQRLNLVTPATFAISTNEMLPAVNQGILAIQFLRSREDLRGIFAPIIDRKTNLVFHAERGAIAALGADCHSAVGCFASVHEEQLRIEGRVYSESGDRFIQSSREIATNTIKNEQLAFEQGFQLGQELLAQGAKELL